MKDPGPILVTIEGPQGSGRSVLADLIASALASEGVSAVVCDEELVDNRDRARHEIITGARVAIATKLSP